MYTEQDKCFALDLMIDGGLSHREVAVQMNCSPEIIMEWIKESGISFSAQRAQFVADAVDRIKRKHGISDESTEIIEKGVCGFFVLYTDGSCLGNPGPGGWAYLLEDPKTGEEITKSGGVRETTNNRMEMQAVIEGLASLSKPANVVVASDSKYVLNGLSKWMKGWKRNGWCLKSGEECKNKDLWKRLDALASTHKLTFQKVKGHSGHRQNEICDMLATGESQKIMEEARLCGQYR